jgi:hypothetical protein
VYDPYNHGASCNVAMKMKFCDDDEYCGLEKHELENPDVLRDE